MRFYQFEFYLVFCTGFLLYSQLWLLQLEVLKESRDAADPFPKKTCALIFKKQIFSFNVCVMSNTSVQSVFCKFCIATTLKYFPTKVYVFWISIEIFLCLRCNWKKQGGISRFKKDVDFLISSNMSLQFYFFRIKVTLQDASYLGLKNITKIFLKKGTCCLKKALFY